MLGSLLGFEDEDEDQIIPGAAAPTEEGGITMAPGAAADEMQADGFQANKSAMVNEYIRNKYGLSDKYSDVARQKIIDQNKADSSGPNWRAGLAALGAGLAGRDAGAAGSAVLKQDEAERMGRLNEFDRGRQQEMQNFAYAQDIGKANRAERDDAVKQAQIVREKDPDSAESKMAQALAKKMNFEGDLSTLTAERFKAFSPALQKMYELEERSKDRKALAAERAAFAGERASERAAVAAERAAERADQKLEGNVGKLSKDIAGAQDMVSSLDEIEAELGGKLEDFDASTSTLKKGGKEVDLPGVSIPGIGRVSGYDDKAQRLQGAASKVFNSVLKDRSGAAVTNSELERLKTEFGEGKYNTESQMVNALQRYKRGVAKELKNREAAYAPEVIDRYSGRGGRTSGSLATPSALSPQDQKALDWATANPTDPRAGQIRQRLGR